MTTRFLRRRPGLDPAALATDSKGNVYVGDAIQASRVQRFKAAGVRRVTTPTY